jgi:hypothetical protein
VFGGKRLMFKRKTNEEGSALIFSIIITIISLSIVSLVVAFAVANLQKTLFVQKYINNTAAAETAISHALAAANSPDGDNILFNAIAENPDELNTVKGTIAAAYSSTKQETQKWLWYTERATANTYYIYAVGYVDTPTEKHSRHIRATLTAALDMEGTYDINTDTITYTPQGQAVTQWGMLGSSSVELSGNVKIQSYNSDFTTTPNSSTGTGNVASNGNIIINDGTNILIDKLVLLNYDSLNPNRCSPVEECDTITQQQITFQTSLTALNTAVDNMCPLETYPTWVASSNAGLLEPGCYDSLTFDADTNISALYTTLNPAKIYVKNNITVNNGVKVNNNNTPYSLQIFSKGSTATFIPTTTTVMPTTFYGIIAGANLTCTDGVNSNFVEPSPLVKIYGALACNSLTFGAGTELWWDEMSLNISSDSETVRKLWYITSFEEVSK